MPTSDERVERTRDAIEVATHTAALALSNISGPLRFTLETLPAMQREALIVRAAVTYLLGRGLLDMPAKRTDDHAWLKLDLPQPYQDDFIAAVQAAVDSHARVLQALQR